MLQIGTYSPIDEEYPVYSVEGMDMACICPYVCCIDPTAHGNSNKLFTYDLFTVHPTTSTPGWHGPLVVSREHTAAMSGEREVAVMKAGNNQTELQLCHTRCIGSLFALHHSCSSILCLQDSQNDNKYHSECGQRHI